MENKLIMFDCFGVILTPIISIWFKKHLPNENIKELMVKYCHEGDIGNLTFEEEAKAIAKDYNLDEKVLLDEWISMVKVNEKLITIIKKLSKKYHVILVSNAPENEVEMLFEKFNLNDIFENVFISYKYKKCKPSIDFYNIAIGNNKYDSIVMIDDSIGNFKYLKEINVDSILFKNNNQLVLELEKLGYLL